MQESQYKSCFHCGEPIDINPVPQKEFQGKMQEFCCYGCLGACQIIHEAGQSSYYNLRQLPAVGSARVKKINPQIQKELESYDMAGVFETITSAQADGLRLLVIQIGGIHCQSCIVLNERLLERIPGIQSAVVQYDSGRCEVLFDPQAVQVSKILKQIHSIGYSADIIQPGKQTKSIQNEVKALLWRLALSAFVAGNVMTLSFALWSGYFDGSLTEEFRRLFQWLEFLLTTPVFFYAAQTFHRGWRSFLKTGIPGMDVLISSGISAAYYYSVFAFFSRQGEIYFDSVSMIVFFLLTGRYLEYRARLKQRERMEGLVKNLPHIAHQIVYKADLSWEVVDTAVVKLKSDDIVMLGPGDTLAADGVLINAQKFGNQYESECEVDEAILTGESLPVKRNLGDRMLAGSKLAGGVAFVKLNGNIHQSGMSALNRLANGVSQKRSGYEEWTKSTIPWFSALVFGIAIISFVAHYLIGNYLEQAIIVLVAVLIVSCPCALALAVPTATSAALYAGVKKGVLLRDGHVIQMISRLKNIFFDKTGTLTCGKPELSDSKFLGDKSKVWQIVNAMEKGNYHPVGQALLENSRKDNTINEMEKHVIQDQSIQYISGKGILYNKNHTTWRLGNLNFALQNQNDLLLQEFMLNNPTATIVVLSKDYAIQALFALEDKPRVESAKTIRRLRRQRFNIRMLTGDHYPAALHIANQIGLKPAWVRAQLLPDDKLNYLKKFIQKRKNSRSGIAMVGDGYNDAPALALADVSIVLARGAPLSLDHAGVILLTNNLGEIFTAMDISRLTLRTIRLNLAISLIYNVVMISIAAVGLLLPIWCALAMALSSLTVIASSAFFRHKMLKYKSNVSY